MKSLSLKQTLILLFSGALFVLAFEPIALPGFGFISSALFFFFLNKNKDNALSTGFIYGFGKYLGGVSWLFLPIKNFSNTPFFIALLLTILLIAFFACYEAIASLLFRILFYKKSDLMKVITFAAIMTLIEFVRSSLLTGFPWLLFGYAQTITPLKHLAPIIGTYGISFFCYLLSALLMLAFNRYQHRFIYATMFTLPFLLCYFIKDITWTQKQGAGIKAAMIQANIKHRDKWSYQYFESLIDSYTTLTNQSFDSDLLIWPETALPVPNTDIEDLLIALESHLKDKKKHLIIGIPYEEAKDKYTNAMMLLGDKQRQVYEKEHLVPFGEYQPLNLLKPILAMLAVPFTDMQPGSPKQRLLQFNGAFIAPLICYEVAFSYILRERLPKANLLLTISDDSWYAHSFLKSQHLQIAKMRSLESEREQLFSTNDGNTAVIDEKGNLVKSLKPDTKGVLKTTVRPRIGQTPWSRFGDRPVMILILVILIISACLPSVKNKRLFVP